MEIDLKDDLETLTNLSAYPFKVPQYAEYPAISYVEMNNTRHDNSSLNDSNIKNHIFEITISTPDSEQVIDVKNSLIERYEGLSGPLGNTNLFISRIVTSMPYYDEAQKNFEYKITVRFTTH